MSNERLNIPSKLKVGFNERTDTYSGKLGYVTYIDKKGKIAKFTSWEHWRSKEMDVEEYDNSPIEGFFLNKKVGGNKTGWNYRQTKCRIYDPRGFEVEISIENLLFILQECTSSKGGILDGSFVYAWDGSEMVLLPVESEDYKLSTQLIEKKEKITAKDLKEGSAYKSKEGDCLIYIGKLEWCMWVWQEGEPYRSGHYMKQDSWQEIKKSKMPTFIDLKSKEFVGFKNMDKLDYLIKESMIPITDVEAYCSNFRTTPAYMMQFVNELSINESLEQWNEYLNSDDKYSWGKYLLMKRPNDNYLIVLRGRKVFLYEDRQYADWLSWKKIGLYSSAEERETAEQEFNDNATVKYIFDVDNLISFENGRLNRYMDGNLNNIRKEVNLGNIDLNCVSDGDAYNFSFLTNKGEIVKQWSCKSLNNARIPFSEKILLPFENTIDLYEKI